MLAEKPNLQKAAEKVKKQLANEQKQKNKAEQEIKEKLDRSAVMHGGGVEVGRPEMPGVHQPSTFSRKISISMFMVG